MMSGQWFERFRREWPTWAALTGCYVIWLTVLVWHQSMGWVWIVPATLMVTLHSSLQHEILHGHPSGTAALNEALVFPAIGLLVPYRRFRDLHLRHHDNNRLTDPYDDPESWYLAEADWTHLSRPMRILLEFNATMAGRLVVGPALALIAMIGTDLRLARAGDRTIRDAWIRHWLGLVPVLAILIWSGVNPLVYAICAAYPGMSLLMVRTFIEHRAAEPVPERTAVVEAGPVMSLLFLNNNLHAVHHRYPCLSWHRLPERWRREHDALLNENAHYYFPGGYIEVMRNWLFTRREPLVHPFLYRHDASKGTERADTRAVELAE